MMAPKVSVLFLLQKFMAHFFMEQIVISPVYLNMLDQCLMPHLQADSQDL